MIVIVIVSMDVMVMVTVWMMMTVKAERLAKATMLVGVAPLLLPGHQLVEA